MLILTRRQGQAIHIIKDDETIVKVYFLTCSHGQLRLGFEADDEYVIHRSEIAEKIIKEKYDNLLESLQNIDQHEVVC